MAIHRQKYYNAIAGKNIGRDSLAKEGAQRCNIPKKLKDIIEESENPEEVIDLLITYAQTLKAQRDLSASPIPREKSPL